jgi:RHS repeat-associated protein
VDEPVLWYEGAGLGSPRGLLADHQGSVVAVSDGTGSSLSINGYDAWGVPNPGNLGRFQYTGQAWLPELGLYHYKARVYSPTLGRFLQTDPVGYEDQVNLYAYVANDPINLVDSNGERAVAWAVRLVKGGVQKTKAFVDKRHAIEARRRGEEVQARSRQLAGQIERGAARDPNSVTRHKGHELRDGSGETGRPHFQSEGQTGHTFWSIASAVLVVSEILCVSLVSEIRASALDLWQPS